MNSKKQCGNCVQIGHDLALVQLFKNLIDAGGSEAGNDADGDCREVVRRREVGDDVQREHAEWRADDAADCWNPLIVDRVDVFDDDSDDVSDHDDRHAGAEAENVFHVDVLLKKN